MVPTVIVENGEPVATLKENDSVIFYNFRPDRAREITRSICDDKFDSFDRPNGYFKTTFVCFTEYDATIENKQVAFVKCAGTCDKAKSKYKYAGNEDCVSAMSVPGGGPKACSFGCTGFGSCVKVCDFDAIHVINGVAVVDKEKCVACGKCVATCPKSLIELVPYAAPHKVQCSSKEFGKAVKEVCSAGCIGCKMCTRVCEADAITVENNIAKIDYSKCTGCGKCAEKCPAKIIL